MQTVKQLEEALRRGKISGRQFLAATTALSVGTAMSPALLGHP